MFSLSAESQRRKNSLLILCYHGLSISDEHEWLPQLYITPETFRERMESLRKAEASVLPFEEALARLKDGSLPPRSVALTFDDGFYDYLKYGLPVLKDFGYPSTVYLTTHYCNYRLPIIGLVLDYVLWKSNMTSITLPDYGIERPFPIEIYSARQAAVKQILEWTEQRGMDTRSKDEIARAIAERLGVCYDSIVESRMLQILSPEEVRSVVKSGVDIQLHTHRHRVPRDRGLFIREVEDNRRSIIELTGKAPAHFCYPSGEYAPEFFGWLESCKVKSATTCIPGLAGRNSGSMMLPRVLDHTGLDELRFESLISGLMI